jgi:hypothetical protein
MTSVCTSQVDDEIWPTEHLEVYRSFDMSWPPSYDETSTFYERTKHMNPRPREIAYLHQHRTRNPYEDEHSYHDMLHNLQWRNSSSGIVGTIVCGSMVWSTKHQKQLTGQELLFLQGFPQERLQSHNSTGQWTNGQCTHLAGNAFNGFMFTALIACGLAAAAPAFAEDAELRTTKQGDGLVLVEDSAMEAMSAHSSDDSCMLDDLEEILDEVE